MLELPESRLPLGLLARRCSQESQRFLQRQPYDPSFCYELFRRALVDQNERAWEIIYTQYTERTPLVYHWIQEHAAFVASGESVDYFANRAFEKMWSALNKRDFSQFPHLRSLLSYLKLCVNSVITDHVRATRPSQIELQETSLADDGTEARQIAEMARAALWEQIGMRLRSDKERLVMYCRYDQGMKPQEIYAAYPDQFQDINDIYRTLQNALTRLRRDRVLQQYYRDNNLAD